MIRLGMRKGAGNMENFLSVVIAVIGILLIAFVAYRLIDVANVSQEAKSAQTLANEIEAKVELMSDGDENEFILKGVEGWYLVGWNKNDALDDKPDKCFDMSCICVCPGPGKEACQEKGICRKIDKGSVEVYTEPFNYIEDTTTSSVVLTKTKFASCVPLDSKLFVLNVTKRSEEILMYSNVSFSYSRYKDCDTYKDDIIVGSRPRATPKI